MGHWHRCQRWTRKGLPCPLAHSGGEADEKKGGGSPMPPDDELVFVPPVWDRVTTTKGRNTFFGFQEESASEAMRRERGLMELAASDIFKERDPTAPGDKRKRRWLGGSTEEIVAPRTEIPQPREVAFERDVSRGGGPEEGAGPRVSPAAQERYVPARVREGYGRAMAIALQRAVTLVGAENAGFAEEGSNPEQYTTCGT